MPSSSPESPAAETAAASANPVPAADPAADSSGKFLAEAAYIPFFNLALQQNAFPFVQELKLLNRTGHDIKDLECRISAVPEFVRPINYPVSLIRSEEALVIRGLDSELNYDLLANLSESVKCKLDFSVAAGGEELVRKEYYCEAFAPDQWLGLRVLPELLASFVTPNLEIISHLQSSAAAELERETGSAAITGYQEGKKRVYQICAAIYRAIHNWGIQYSLAASTFGVPGQRVRFADTIYQYKLGTCLDTTLLFASVMEACRLHPVIVIQTGHAYLGCHLEDRYFPDIPMDDLQTIRKLADLDEFLVIETTMVTGNATFAEAEAQARLHHLNQDDEFLFAVDVVRARYSGIRPLPLKRSVNGIEFAPVEREVAEQEAEAARELENGIDLSELSSGIDQPARVVRWTKKLLDLSLRNRLLNVRDTKYIIPVACTDITFLEDKIAANESLTLNSLPNLLGEKDLHDLAMLRNSEVQPRIKEILDQELSQRRLWTALQPKEMNRRLTALYRQGKTDLEEGGVNTIYMAVGFLEWKISERDERSYLAPILLLPVRLQRRSISEGIRITRVDGDTLVNETLLELLSSQYHVEVPGMKPLPEDDSGVDVGKVMRIFRAAIKDLKGWEVREEARIGHFSFGKYVMWNDMTARMEILKKNPLIGHLISGSGLYDDGIEVFPPEEIDSHLDVSRLYCPVSADSSQLAAVLYSELGKNFVLHGPPGTGKSQTITNIIAHNLAIGKRVLFVSEKKAALDVVHKRLTQIGLKPFCLELHSNKSGKAQVLAQFVEALLVAETGVPADWQNTVSELNSLRAELDGYVRGLHHLYPNGFSAYDCFSHLLTCGEQPGAAGLSLEKDLLEQSAQDQAECRRKFLELAECRKIVDPDSLTVFSKLDLPQWSPVFENGLLDSARKLKSAAEDLKRSSAAAEAVSLRDLHRVSTCYQTALILQTLKNSEDTPRTFFGGDFPELAEFISVYAENAQKFLQLTDRLSNYRLEQFPEYDFPGISERLARNETSFFLLKFFKNRALLNDLAGLKKSGGVKLSIPELKELLPVAGEYVESRKQYEDGKNRAAGLLGKLWNDGNVDWTALKTKIDNARTILEQVAAVAGTDEDLKHAMLTELQKIMPEVSQKCGRGSAFRQEIDTMLSAWNVFRERLEPFLSYSPELAAVDDLDTLADELGRIVSHLPQLRNVVRYRNLRGEVDAAGLERLAAQLESLPPADDPGRLYDGVFFHTMLNQILDRSPLLCQFSGTLQNEKVRKFCELDARYMALTRKMIFAKLAANLPRRRSGPCPEGTELGILKRECEKHARQKPIRMLLEQIPSLAPLLKPCFLMSPLSVAQYLPAESEPFDLIVFDEASQIPVWDAIGVIARGKQLIVVGDPRQMPPTNFFQKGESADDDSSPEETEDLESILDECIVAGVHSTYLNWHYRSRHESLIAFSNHHYYDDRLCTFPAACNTEKLGVRFEFVPGGVYDRKASRTNRPEAEALVRYVFRRLELAGGKYRSIGIVTFSQAQKDLIEDLLEKERAGHPALESCFDETREEPLFVKNLENVQGDERDVILFSIGYAPDAAGRFSMNFGPLNRQGGERRLNVAITRAKEQVVVFSSIHADQIDLARTNAVGAAHLKFFLEYAEKGTSIHSPSVAEGVSDGVSGTIADFLISKGYAVERNVGCSGFRIDLAVRHPDHPEHFLLGIECDNSVYAAQNTTRDRDSLRRQVLAGLGWHLYRAWSVDWAFDRKRAEAELLEFIEQARTAMPEPEPAPPPEPPAASVPVDPPAETPPAPPPVSENRKEYICWQNAAPALPQDAFYEPSNRNFIRRQICEVIEQEAPICEHLLKRRIARAWGFTRTGGSIVRILDECLPVDRPVTRFGEARVFWSASQSPADYRSYRVGIADDAKRAIDEIPPEELANAMYEVLVDFHSCEKDTLFRETVRLFGFSAVTAKARKFLEYGFAALQNSGRV